MVIPTLLLRSLVSILMKTHLLHYCYYYQTSIRICCLYFAKFIPYSSIVEAFMLLTCDIILSSVLHLWGWILVHRCRVLQKLLWIHHYEPYWSRLFFLGAWEPSTVACPPVGFIPRHRTSRWTRPRIAEVKIIISSLCRFSRIWGEIHGGFLLLIQLVLRSINT